MVGKTVDLAVAVEEASKELDFGTKKSGLTSGSALFFYYAERTFIKFSRMYHTANQTSNLAVFKFDILCNCRV